MKNTGIRVIVQVGVFETGDNGEHWAEINFEETAELSLPDGFDEISLQNKLHVNTLYTEAFNNVQDRMAKEKATDQTALTDAIHRGIIETKGDIHINYDYE